MSTQERCGYTYLTFIYGNNLACMLRGSDPTVGVQSAFIKWDNFSNKSLFKYVK